MRKPMRMSQWPGAGFATQTVAGLFTGEFSTSATYSGSAGYAVQLGYGYDRFDWFGPYKSAIRLLGEYRSQDYTAVGNFTNPASYNTSIAASYSQKLPYDMTAGLVHSPSISLQAERGQSGGCGQPLGSGFLALKAAHARSHGLAVAGLWQGAGV